MKFKSLDNNIDNIANMVNSLHEKLTTKLKSNSTKNHVNDIENNLLNDLKVEIQRIPLVQIFEELEKEKKVDRESVNRISNRIMLS